MHVRPERPADTAAIHAITAAAFATMPHSYGSEPRIVDALRYDGALTLSLVVEEEAGIVGHVPFSPVRIDGREGPWFGLGPVSVRADRQRRGIGSALVREGVRRLAGMGAQACVVLGDLRYYGRFGFAHDPALTYRSAILPSFQRLVLRGEPPVGAVSYHGSFEES